MTDMRIGHGYDVHAFESGDHIMLGGVRIDHTQAFRAHSDGDVLIHAICDAVLGALALGDIGRHFPDTDPQYAGADSRELLRQVVALMRDHGYSLSNLDATIVAQAPKLSPHIDAMRYHLADDFSSHLDRVNIKATTTEQLGFAGRQEGMAAHAVVLLIKD